MEDDTPLSFVSSVSSQKIKDFSDLTSHWNLVKNIKLAIFNQTVLEIQEIQSKKCPFSIKF